MSAGSLNHPYLILLLTGFAKHDSHLPPGGLLPHPFTLTRCGNRAVCSLLHFPAPRGDWTLSSVMPCGARTFLPRVRGSDYQDRSAKEYNAGARNLPTGNFHAPCSSLHKGFRIHTLKHQLFNYLPHAAVCVGWSDDVRPFLKALFPVSHGNLYAGT